MIVVKLTGFLDKVPRVEYMKQGSNSEKGERASQGRREGAPELAMVFYIFIKIFCVSFFGKNFQNNVYSLYNI